MISHPLFARYAELKQKEKEITQELDQLKPEVVREMNALEADKIETDVGAFLLMKRKNWTFSENCLAMKATLEEAQATEQADGTATFVESVTVSFRGK